MFRSESRGDTMTYFQVDDHFHSNRKVFDLPLEAVGFWVIAGSWCAQELSDGFVPDSLVRRYGGTDSIINALLDSGLWTVAEGGYQFHEWADHNKTREQVEADRAKWKEKNERRKSYRDSVIADTPVVTPEVTPGVTLCEQEQGTGNKEQGTKEVIKKEENRFLEFWFIYPRKEGKQAAKKAWDKAVSAESQETIIAAASRYAEARSKEDPKYTKMPTTWLNAGCWDDEVLQSHSAQTPLQRKRQEQAAMIERFAALDAAGEIEQ